MLSHRHLDIETRPNRDYHRTHSGERVELEETNSEKDFQETKSEKGVIINNKLKWDPTRKKDIKNLEQVQR